MHDSANAGDTMLQQTAKIIEMDKIRRTRPEVLAHGPREMQAGKD